MSRERTVFLRHVLLCLDKIERYTADGKQAFMRDAKTQDAVVRNLEIIGQAVKDLGTDDLSIRHPADLSTAWLTDPARSTLRGKRQRRAFDRPTPLLSAIGDRPRFPLVTRKKKPGDDWAPTIGVLARAVS